MSDTPAIEIPTISPEELLREQEAKTAFVLDLRMKSAGEQVPGALRYDPKQIVKADPLVLPIPHDGITVLVDDEETSSDLTAVAEALARFKYLDVRTLAGGFDAWTAAGHPTAELTMKQPVAGAADHQLFR